MVVTSTAETSEMSITNTPQLQQVSQTNTPIHAFVSTPSITQIQVAEQVFEHGRMFWIQPLQQIWVMINNSQDGGSWIIYADIFQDNEAETTTSIVVPEGMFYPERGFGALWLSTPDIQESLGFGVTPECGYVSTYEYHPGGIYVGSLFVPGPGYHILYNLYGNEKFQFNETEGTWTRLR